jgi:hypothetical protein
LAQIRELTEADLDELLDQIEEDKNELESIE